MERLSAYWATDELHHPCRQHLHHTHRLSAVREERKQQPRTNPPEMTDRLTPEQRLRCMRSNRSKGTRPEERLSGELWRRGYRYRRNVRGVVGTPDICFKRWKVAIFVDGEFWHGRNWGEAQHRIKSNRDFWYRKIERNMARDQRVNEELRNAGWTVLRFWDSEINASLEECADRIEAVLREERLSHLHRVYAYDTRYEALESASDFPTLAAEDEADYKH